MKLVVFTLVYNGMPFIPTIFFNLQATNLDWRWIVAEGAAKNTHCTAWCNRQEPGLSTDGTSEFLDMISKHPRVTILRKEMWDGKVEMCNACLAEIKESCVLLQQDSDELWRPDVIEKVFNYLTGYGEHRDWKSTIGISCAMVKCRYFLGVNIVATSREGYGNKRGEWLRIWRFTVGDKFERHEPPQLKQSLNGPSLDLGFNLDHEVFFDHYAWWSENQVAYKEQFYNYPNALQCWRRLQENREWPVKSLKQFLPWVGDGATADRVV